VSNPFLILSIDPGVSGALAVYNPINKEVISIQDLPIFELKGKKKLDLVQLSMIIDSYSKDLCLVSIEEVGVMTGLESRSSMFNFGYTAGGIAGICSTLLLPTCFIRPNIWKNHLGLSRDKDESRFKASQIFPKYAHLWPLKKHDGRAEALLLAYFTSTHILKYPSSSNSSKPP